MSNSTGKAPVTTGDAPGTDAPTNTGATNGPVTARDARKARMAEQAAKAERSPKFTLDAGAEWRECAGGGEIGVCNSAPNAAGESFLYVVYRHKGKDTAVPLHAVDKLMEAGDL